MTDEQDTTDDTAGKAEKVRMAALRAFGRAIWGAGAAYETELARAADEAGIKVRDVPRADDFSKALSLATFIGGCFASGEILEFDDRQTLERLHAALRPIERNEAIDLALTLIEGYASEYEAADGADARARIVRRLVNSLAAQVHPEFVVLRQQLEAIAPWLLRFTASKAMNPKRGEEPKFGAPGVLLELNRLADPVPPHRGLNGPLKCTTTAQISSASWRHRTTLRNGDV